MVVERKYKGNRVSKGQRMGRDEGRGEGSQDVQEGGGEGDSQGVAKGDVDSSTGTSRSRPRRHAGEKDRKRGKTMCAPGVVRTGDG